MNLPKNVIIAPADPGDLAAVVTLFRAYAASLPVDLAYQGFEAELAGLPGKYAHPSGALLIAKSAESIPLGCVALRAVDAHRVAEMKRLYVAPAGRGLGLGRRLVDAAVAEARQLGYRELWLDTLPTMTEAITLYGRCGFEPMAPYYEIPVAGTRFMRRELGGA